MTVLRLRQPLPPLRAGRPADAALTERRAASPALLPASPVPAMHSIGGVNCVVVEAAGDGPVIVHLHGGGYRMGSAVGWTSFAMRLSGRCGASVVVPEYALAPECPFPAAHHDVLAVLTAIMETLGGRKLLLSGDSAGGGLALAVAALLEDTEVLAGLVLLSPWADLRLIADSYHRCAATDLLFSLQAATTGADEYRQGWAAEDPLVSPLMADFDTLPPVCLLASTSEVLADDAMHLAQRLYAAERPLTLLMLPGLPHDWPVLEPGRRESGHALDVIAGFVSAL